MADKDLDGFLVVDKPPGWTSYDVVEFIKRRFRVRKIGHGGTLDPIAQGILVIGLGRSTRQLTQFMSSDKTYRMTLRLGRRTDTQDITGKSIAEVPVPDIPRARFEKVLDDFRGEISQTMPKYSAVKYKGKPYYYYARKGMDIPVKTRRVVIRDIHVLDYRLPLVELEVTCGTGAYMRTLCDSIGEKLGIGGCLEALVRTRCGVVDMNDIIDIRTVRDREDLESKRYWPGRVACAR